MRNLIITKQITHRETRALDSYLHDIGKLPMISSDEEVELAQRIRLGDQRALDKMVNANLRFVVSVAKQYQNQGLQLVDLINEGNMGLVRAAKRFDEKRGFKFISYAVWWIRQAILQALAENVRMVRLPLNKIGNINRINKTYSFLEQAHERPPSPEEIAKDLDITIKEVKDSMRVSGRHLSMDAPLNEGEDSNLHDLFRTEDTLHPDGELINESMIDDIQRVLNTLPSRQADVLRMFYGIGKNTPLSLEEIGMAYDITRERARQIKEKAIRSLKNSSRNKILITYLE